MRAQGRDIVELFGYRPDDLSPAARQAFANRHCPFSNSQCSKTNHDQSIIYGVCSVSNGTKVGAHDQVIVCPKRLYQKQYGIFHDLVGEVWGADTDLIIGGTLPALQQRAAKVRRPAIAFGHDSGTEISVNSNGQMSMDWVIQNYTNDGGLNPQQFIGIEVQSIDITGNYRDNWSSYEQMKTSGQIPNAGDAVVNSGHGLNWANVHKRLIPQIIRKGNIYRMSDRCAGFYFVVPEVVYRKFEEVIGPLPELDGPANDRISIKTYSFGPVTPDGESRDICPVRTVHFDLLDVARAFITNVDEDAPTRLDQRLRGII